jgi:hypothetical protein
VSFEKSREFSSPLLHKTKKIINLFPLMKYFCYISEVFSGEKDESRFAMAFQPFQEKDLLYGMLVTASGWMEKPSPRGRENKTLSPTGYPVEEARAWR